MTGCGVSRYEHFETSPESRYDRAGIATCSFLTPTDRCKDNYSIDKSVSYMHRLEITSIHINASLHILSGICLGLPFFYRPFKHFSVVRSCEPQYTTCPSNLPSGDFAYVINMLFVFIISFHGILHLGLIAAILLPLHLGYCWLYHETLCYDTY